MRFFERCLCRWAGLDHDSALSHIHDAVVFGEVTVTSQSQFDAVIVGGEMMTMTWRSLLSAEGYLDMEAHDSDLRGSRGVFLAGMFTFYMGVLNMLNTLATLYDKQRAKRLARKKSYANLSNVNSPTKAASISSASSPDKEK